MLCARIVIAVTALTCVSASGQTKSGGGDAGNRITILYDAFTSDLGLVPDWGYSALVEFEGKRILFDTGNNAAIFENNVKRLRIDLTQLDLVVLSHRHGDHISGLRYLLSVNPKVPVYGPVDESFRDSNPREFFTTNADASLPPRMRYFAGNVPASTPHGTAWTGTHIHTVEHMQDFTPHIHLISTLSETAGFRDMSELSLVLDTPRGPIVIVGCSHPAIENILANLVQQTRKSGVFEIVGGLHMVVSTPEQIDHTVSELLDRYHVQRVAPGHCSGERAFALLRKRLGAEYIYAGMGQILPL